MIKLKQLLKEYTDNNFSGAKLIADTKAKKPDQQRLKFIQQYFPNGFKSERKAEQALRDHDASPTKAIMGQYAPMFVHVQYHPLTGEDGQQYIVHQSQYYNSNFENKNDKFNPEVTVLTFERKLTNGSGLLGFVMGSILCLTDEYIKDLQTLNSKKLLGQRDGKLRVG